MNEVKDAIEESKMEQKQSPGDFLENGVTGAERRREESIVAESERKETQSGFHRVILDCGKQRGLETSERGPTLDENSFESFSEHEAVSEASNGTFDVIRSDGNLNMEEMSADDEEKGKKFETVAFFSSGDSTSLGEQSTSVSIENSVDNTAEISKAKGEKSKRVGGGMTRLQEAEMILQIYDALSAYRRPNSSSARARKLEAIGKATELLSRLRKHLEEGIEEDENKEKETRTKQLMAKPSLKTKNKVSSHGAEENVALEEKLESATDSSAMEFVTASKKDSTLVKSTTTDSIKAKSGAAKEVKKVALPKIPKTVFHLFSSERSEIIRSQQKELSKALVKSKVEEEWRGLSLGEMELWTSKFLVRFGGLYRNFEGGTLKNEARERYEGDLSSLSSSSSSAKEAAISTLELIQNPSKMALSSQNSSRFVLPPQGSSKLKLDPPPNLLASSHSPSSSSSSSTCLPSPSPSPSSFPLNSLSSSSPNLSYASFMSSLDLLPSSSVADLSHPPPSTFLWKLSRNPRLLQGLDDNAQMLSDVISSLKPLCAFRLVTVTRPDLQPSMAIHAASRLIALHLGSHSILFRLHLEHAMVAMKQMAVFSCRTSTTPKTCSLEPLSSLVPPRSTSSMSTASSTSTAASTSATQSTSPLPLPSLPLPSSSSSSSSSPSSPSSLVLPSLSLSSSLASLSLLPSLESSPSISRSIALCPSGRFLYVSDADHYIRKWDLEHYQLEKEVWNGGMDCFDLSLSVDGTSLIWISQDKHIYLVDTLSMVIRRRYGSNGEKRLFPNVKFVSASLSPNGLYLASGDLDGVMRIWNNEHGELIFRNSDHQAAISRICFLNNLRLLSASIDGEIRIWDAESVQKSHLIAKLRTSIISLEVDVKKSIIFVGGKDQLIRLFRLPECTESSQLEPSDPMAIVIGHKASVMDIKKWCASKEESWAELTKESKEEEEHGSKEGEECGMKEEEEHGSKEGEECGMKEEEEIESKEESEHEPKEETEHESLMAELNESSKESKAVTMIGRDDYQPALDCSVSLSSDGTIVMWSF